MTTIYVNEQERMGVATVYDTAANPKVIQKGGCTLTRSGGTATAYRAAHGYTTADVITIAGADQADYNGDKTITVTDADHFTFAVSNSPVTPATGTITAAHINESRWMVAPKAIQIESIAGATTVKVEVAIRLSLGWKQYGADLTSADNGAIVVLPQMYNYVRLRRSAGTGAVKAHAQQ